MPKKRFGQHFLNDAHVIDDFLTQVSPQASDHFVEIGPGEGAMTLSLLQAPVAKLDAIEIERDAFQAVKQRTQHIKTLCLHQADASRFDFQTIYAGQPMRLI